MVFDENRTWNFNATDIPIVLVEEGTNKNLLDIDTPLAKFVGNTSLTSSSLYNMLSDLDMHISDFDNSDACEWSNSDSTSIKFWRVSDIYRSTNFVYFTFRPTCFEDVEQKTE